MGPVNRLFSGPQICRIDAGQDQDVTAIELGGVFWTGGICAAYGGQAAAWRHQLAIHDIVEAIMAPLLACWPYWLFVRVSERDRTTVIHCCRHTRLRANAPRC